MTLVQEAIAAFTTTTTNARSLDNTVKKNVLFLLDNIKSADKIDVVQNQLYELEGTHQVLMGKASASYLKKLAAFNTTLANYIHAENKKEKEVIATTPQPQPKEETVATQPKWGFIPLLQHLGIKGTIPSQVLDNVRCRQWVGGRTFTNTKNGGAKWSELLTQVATVANAGNQFTVTPKKSGHDGLVYGIKITARATVRVTVSMNSGYDIVLVDNKGGTLILASRNTKKAANDWATGYAEQNKLIANCMN